MHEFFQFGDEIWWISLAQVILIDLTLAADNAVVIGLAARSLQGRERRHAIAIGILAATIIRVIFAIFAIELMEMVGLLFVGGILLLYVAWKMWREMRLEVELTTGAIDAPPEVSFRRVVFNIILADISMSLDNVLAVAGAARDHMDVLVIGLVLSIAFMGMASTAIARLLEKHRWIAYIGLLIVLYVALNMVWEGAHQVMEIRAPH